MGGKRQAALVPARGLGTCPMGSLILKGGRPRAVQERLGTNWLGPGVGLVLVLKLTLWKEESWEPVSCGKSFKEITVFIRRMFGCWAG